MKDIVEILASHGVVCKRLEELSPKVLGSRKRVLIYRGVEIDQYFCFVIVVKKKSRILHKEAREFDELHRRLEQKMEAKIKRLYLIYDAPLCSKAASWLEALGWRLFIMGGD